jgi:hypothetical protein
MGALDLVVEMHSGGWGLDLPLVDCVFSLDLVISGIDFDHLLAIWYSGSLHHYGQYREGMARNP